MLTLPARSGDDAKGSERHYKVLFFYGDVLRRETQRSAGGVVEPARTEACLCFAHHCDRIGLHP